MTSTGRLLSAKDRKHAIRVPRSLRSFHLRLVFRLAAPH
ncbi:uncharacterized protein METZ01_LOCUS440264, partial [marine metagenome]